MTISHYHPFWGGLLASYMTISLVRHTQVISIGHRLRLWPIGFPQPAAGPARQPQNRGCHTTCPRKGGTEPNEGLFATYRRNSGNIPLVSAARHGRGLPSRRRLTVLGRGAVEDFSYPDAAQILAERGILLKRGNGNITLAACAAGSGQITVKARGASDICFQATGSRGYLSLEIPRATGIHGDGTHDVTANVTTNGETSTVSVNKNLWTAIGEAADPEGREGTLVEITSTGPAGPATGPAPEQPFAAKLAIGTDKRSCTGALVDPLWVITAASCFTDTPDQASALAPGAPKDKTTATIGRGDLTSTTGQVRDVVKLVPRTDRDLVLARLATPVTDITPISLSTTAPITGEDLQSIGFGRTKTEWVPTKSHTATFTVDTTAPA
ncbi:trypsin-like serine protease [Kitasatospora arboriphila]